MKNSSINRQILALAVPSIVANVTTPLLGLIDTAIVGHMGSAVFIAAIAVGGTMFNMVYWMFGFLRMGASGTTAQQWGRQNMQGVSNVLCRSLLIALIAGILIVVLQIPLFKLMARVMDADADTIPFASRYFHILVFGAPAVLANYSLVGWFVGIQNSRVTMWVSVAINVVNILLSLILVFGFHFGIAGIATGTLVAQWTGCLLYLTMAFRHGFSVSHIKMPEIFNRSELKRFFAINFDIFLRTLCLIAVTVWFTRVGSTQGNVMLAVNTLLMQFFILFSYMMDGFAYAGEALAGRYTGAADHDHFKQTVVALFRWGVGVALVFTFIYFAGGSLIVKLLSNEPSVIAASSEYRWWIVTIPLAGFAAFTWDGVFVGTTQTRMMLLSMFIAMAVFFGMLLIFYPKMGNHGLWLSFVCYLAVRGIVLTIAYRKISVKIPFGQ